jgi:hypothetical protein
MSAGPAGTGPAAPSLARTYSYLLGGRHYYPADQAAAENVLPAAPHRRSIARASCRFLARAVQI